MTERVGPITTIGPPNVCHIQYTQQTIFALKSTWNIVNFFQHSKNLPKWSLNSNIILVFKITKVKLSTHASQWFYTVVNDLVLNYNFFTLWSKEIPNIFGLSFFRIAHSDMSISTSSVHCTGKMTRNAERK